jgi:uncharacterized membrane protein
MILEVSDDASLLVRGSAALILTLHIAGGGVGILSGAAALVVRKGGRLHRLAGNAFFLSMLIMSSIAAAVSPFLPTPQWPDAVAGAFTFYLVATSWMTVRRKEGSVGRFESWALVAALCIASSLVFIAVFDPTAANAGPAYVFSILALLAAVGDFRMIRRGGITGAQRISRHLWRMIFALFIATGSLFVGQPQVFPDVVRGTGLLFVPVILVLGSLVYWMVRVRVSKQYKKRVVAAI